MIEKEKQLTSEEIIKFIAITINDKGTNGGLYGLLKKIEVENCDEIFKKIQAYLETTIKDEVQNIDEGIKIESAVVKSTQGKETVAPTEYRKISSISNETESASIYAKEHLRDVQDDLITHTKSHTNQEDSIPSLNQPKVLERKIPPVNFAGCETVAPGQFKK